MESPTSKRVRQRQRSAPVFLAWQAAGMFERYGVSA